MCTLFMIRDKRKTWRGKYCEYTVIWNCYLELFLLLEISSLLSQADLHTVELSTTFHSVTHLLCNNTRIVVI